MKAVFPLNCSRGNPGEHLTSDLVKGRQLASLASLASLLSLLSVLGKRKEKKGLARLAGAKLGLARLAAAKVLRDTGFGMFKHRLNRAGLA